MRLRTIPRNFCTKLAACIGKSSQEVFSVMVRLRFPEAMTSISGCFIDTNYPIESHCESPLTLTNQFASTSDRFFLIFKSRSNVSLVPTVIRCQHSVNVPFRFINCHTTYHSYRPIALIEIIVGIEKKSVKVWIHGWHAIRIDRIISFGALTCSQQELPSGVYSK